jgi:hypothetical protein
MRKSGNIGRIAILVLLLLPGLLFSQERILHGVVKDEVTLKPVPGANIRINGSVTGTSTNAGGEFDLAVGSLPCGITVSCIGYEEGSFRVTGVPHGRVEFVLSSKAYRLKEVEIPSDKYTRVFHDRDYSVLDYELLGKNILLLVFRTNLNTSELVLLDREGDTLGRAALPDLPPASLYRDFLGNVHYIAKSGYAYQFTFNEKRGIPGFLHGIPADSLHRTFYGLIFPIGKRIYFEQVKQSGFRVVIGYYLKGTGRIVIRDYTSEKKMTEAADDQQFYAAWNTLIASQASQSGTAAGCAQSPKLGQYMNQFDQRAYRYEFYTMNYPVVKTPEDEILFFNFGDGNLERLDMDGNTRKIVPVTFHREGKNTSDTLTSGKTGWRWSSGILANQGNSEVYTSYLKNGMVRIHAIDTETGRLKRGTVLPLPFPEKIEIYNGEAFFLHKGEGENWEVVRCTL